MTDPHHPLAIAAPLPRDVRVSFEFFPPKTVQGQEKLLATQKKLLVKKPAFFSCTFGAGGSTRDNTRSMVDLLREQFADTAPHLSCLGQSREEIMELVNGYKDKGVKRIVALRGDLPSGMGYAQSDLKYADELVALIREETGDHFHLEVAAYPENHPQSRSFDDDIAHFQRKIDAGADSGLTQYFYNADAVEIARNVKLDAGGAKQITDVNRVLLDQGCLRVEVLGRGWAWLDSGTPDSLLAAGIFAQVMEQRTGLKLACPEEVAYRMENITAKQLRELATASADSDYGRYLLGILKLEGL